jgi:hypothetical protein
VGWGWLFLCAVLVEEGNGGGVAFVSGTWTRRTEKLSP